MIAMIKQSQLKTSMARRTDHRYFNSAEVAEILGITKTSLKNWLRGERIPEPTRDEKNNYRLWTVSNIEELRGLIRNGRLIRNVEARNL